MTIQNTAPAVPGSACSNFAAVTGALMPDDVIGELYIQNGYLSSLLVLLCADLDDRTGMDGNACQCLYLAAQQSRRVGELIGQLENMLPVAVRFGKGAGSHD